MTELTSGAVGTSDETSTPEAADASTAAEGTAAQTEAPEALEASAPAEALEAAAPAEAPEASAPAEAAEAPPAAAPAKPAPRVVPQPPIPAPRRDNPDVGLSEMTREELAAAIDETIKLFDDGDLVQGTVVRVDKDEVLLDIGYKTEGVIPARELTIKQDVDPREVVKVGDQIEALVTQKEDKEGRLILSVKRARYERAWGDIERIMHEDGVVTGTVIEVVKGGLILDIGLRGFLPASLVDLRRVRDLQPFLAKELECKIVELDRNRNNVVLSRRKWLEESQSENRREFLENLQKGEVKEGTVSSIVNFGAFVDLGGVDGLIHVSELSWKHVEHPSEVVKVGDAVKVEVLDVDLGRERISLSLKKTQEDPWTQFSREHQVEEILDGQVTKLVPFGAFVRVADGVEGLVHISELAGRHVESADEVVTPGQRVQVKVIEIDPDRRRVSLSIRQTLAEGDEGMTTATTPPADGEAPAATDGEAPAAAAPSPGAGTALGDAFAAAASAGTEAPESGEVEEGTEGGKDISAIIEDLKSKFNKE